MNATMIMTITLLAGILVIVGAIYFQKSLQKSWKNKAQMCLQSVLQPGEELIEFTKVNTKGPSLVTVLLTGWVGAAISRIGGIKLYVGLTSRRMVLVSVKPSDGSQAIYKETPLTNIKDISVKHGVLDSSTLTIHTFGNGVWIFHIANDMWKAKSTTLEKSFSGVSL